MNRTLSTRPVVIKLSILCILLLSACSQPSDEPSIIGESPQAEDIGRGDPREFAFKGTVEQVDASAETIKVNNEAIPGWMNSMTMTYTVDHPEVLKSLKPGDKITATVFDSNYQTLYGVKVVSP